MAFLWGGLICLIGQVIIFILTEEFGVERLDANTLMIGIMIIIASLLSAFGIYDRIGQYAKCGSIIPITGFANSMVSSAMEYHPEGIILGVGANTFKLAGSVIVLGVGAAYVVSLIRYIIMVVL